MFDRSPTLMNPTPKMHSTVGCLVGCQPSGMSDATAELVMMLLVVVVMVVLWPGA
jgi:hypothetical protein